MKLRITLLGLLLLATCANAQQLDTLRTHSTRGGYVYYTDPAITMQAARFEVNGPVRVHAVALMLGGRNVGGSARLHVYGHEGGLPAPGLGRDLVRPITVKKTRAGVEQISVVFPSPVDVKTHQFFIAVDNISPDVQLVSDRRATSPACVSGDDNFAYQVLRRGAGVWQWGVYSYVIEPVVEYVRAAGDVKGFADMTKALGIVDTPAQAASIAWADVNDDRYVDLLLDGKLYRNIRGEHFQDVTEAAGLSGKPAAALFLDGDNDGAQDILFLGMQEGEKGTSCLYHNNGDGRFERLTLELPSIQALSAVSIGDADGDGYLDFFVGMTAGGDKPYRLFVNDRRNGFRDRTDLLERENAGPVRVTGSQWVDVDGDGDLDLFVACDDPAGDYLWLREPDGRFRNANGTSLEQLAGEGLRVGCHWADYDNDGDRDLLLPRRQRMSVLREGGSASGVLMRSVSSMQYERDDDVPVEYEEQRAAGVWADVDNDGLLDMILTTSCGCRYASLYQQVQGAGFRQKTYEWGLMRTAAGRDAAWVDYDNDGRMDMSTFVDCRFRLFRNAVATPNNTIALDLQGSHAVGARAEVFVRGARYTRDVTAGRGMLMQEPMRLNFGIGPESRVDSVNVRWSNGRVDSYHDLAINTLHRLVEGSDAATMEGAGVADISIAPNPVTERLHLRFTLNADQELRLGIYRLDGVLVRTLAQGIQKMGTHDVIWDTKDDSGKRVAQGTYLYRLLVRSGEQSGKFVVVR